MSWRILLVNIGVFCVSVVPCRILQPNRIVGMRIVPSCNVLSCKFKFLLELCSRDLRRENG